MRLLVTTQVVNENDTNLGFFCEWLKALAASVDELHVICLFEGEHHLPSNVKIYSLGKEKGNASRFTYAQRFYARLKELRGQYDAVFVHMNPEYPVLAGLKGEWRGKKVLLWYVHKAVNFRLWLAEKFVTKIFTASKESFRLASSKVQIVGHGILDNPINGKHEKSFLWVGRKSASKNENVARAAAARANVAIDFVSDIPPGQMPSVYAAHQALVHTSATGSIDKVVLEALASGLAVITTSEAFRSLSENELKNIIFYCPPRSPEELAKTIEKVWQSGILSRVPYKEAIDYVRKNHNLYSLVEKIIAYLAA